VRIERKGIPKGRSAREMGWLNLIGSARMADVNPGAERTVRLHAIRAGSMIGPRITSNWVGLICDASSATFFAARGTGAEATLLGVRQAEYEPAQLHTHGSFTALEQFVAEHRLRDCDVRVAFAGSGTIVQRLTLPPLSVRDQLQAVRTHLMNYADGGELVIDVARDARRSRHERVRLLAVGVDRALSRGIYAGCRRAGLRVRSMGALATSFGPAAKSGTLMQLILGERTTTIQLFDDARLIASRDVLPGRRDFVGAYQRPILTDTGPVTLSPEEAEALLCEVGIPVNREGEIRPGMLASQLWPTLNPVLQQLMHEIGQSFTHSNWETPENAAISVLGLPVPPGLDEFLAVELRLHGVATAPGSPESGYLSAFAGHGGVGVPLDLRPAEQQFAARTTRPALAAGLCALVIMLANSIAPRQADARLSELRPIAAQLQGQVGHAQRWRDELQSESERLATGLQRSGKLLEALPRTIPAVGPLKVAFGSVPPEVELLEVRLIDEPKATTLLIRAGYHGRVPASIVAARWGRALSKSVFFADARVTSVSGSGHDRPAMIEILAELKGG
jgi:hypothetical protein